MRTSTLIVSVLLSSAVVAGCHHESSPSSWTGDLPSSDAAVGAVVVEDRAVVYVCGGPASLSTATRWFEGTVEELSIGIAHDGWVVDARTDDHEIGHPLVGQVRAPDGATFAFRLAATEPGSVAGLYSTIDAGCRTGVVVREGVAGQEPELQGVWCNATGEVDQVTPGIAPLVLEDGALTVAVERPEGLRELQVRPFIP